MYFKRARNSKKARTKCKETVYIKSQKIKKDLKWLYQHKWLPLKLKGGSYDWKYFSTTATWKATERRLSAEYADIYKNTWIRLQGEKK